MDRLSEILQEACRRIDKICEDMEAELHGRNKDVEDPSESGSDEKADGG
jgi:hypothetical protein